MRTTKRSGNEVTDFFDSFTQGLAPGLMMARMAENNTQSEARRRAMERDEQSASAMDAAAQDWGDGPLDYGKYRQGVERNKAEADQWNQDNATFDGAGLKGLFTPKKQAPALASPGQYSEAQAKVAEYKKRFAEQKQAEGEKVLADAKYGIVHGATIDDKRAALAGVMDFYNKTFPDGRVADIHMDDDGGITFQRSPAGATWQDGKYVTADGKEARAETRRFKDANEFFDAARNMNDPKSWAKMTEELEKRREATRQDVDRANEVGAGDIFGTGRKDLTYAEQHGLGSFMESKKQRDILNADREERRADAKEAKSLRDEQRAALKDQKDEFGREKARLSQEVTLPGGQKVTIGTLEKWMKDGWRHDADVENERGEKVFVSGESRTRQAAAQGDRRAQRAIEAADILEGLYAPKREETPAQQEQPRGDGQTQASDPDKDALAAALAPIYKKAGGGKVSADNRARKEAAAKPQDVPEKSAPPATGDEAGGGLFPALKPDPMYAPENRKHGWLVDSVREAKDKGLSWSRMTPDEREAAGMSRYLPMSSSSYGKRDDGSEKGRGFFGELKRPDGKVSTEISIGVNIGGKEMEIPALVPTLTQDEINTLLAGESPSQAIMDKAVSHAKERIAAGLSPFASDDEAIPWDERNRRAETKRRSNRPSSVTNASALRR